MLTAKPGIASVTQSAAAKSRMKSARAAAGSISVLDAASHASPRERAAQPKKIRMRLGSLISSVPKNPSDARVSGEGSPPASPCGGRSGSELLKTPPPSQPRRRPVQPAPRRSKSLAAAV
jgi:hypothetical protein